MFSLTNSEVMQHAGWGMMLDWFFDWLIVLIPFRWFLIGVGLAAVLLFALYLWAR